MLIRQFKLWWDFADVQLRRDLVVGWYDLVLMADKQTLTAYQVAALPFEALPISVVYDLSQDKIFPQP